MHLDIPTSSKSPSTASSTTRVGGPPSASPACAERGATCTNSTNRVGLIAALTAARANDRRSPSPAGDVADDITTYTASTATSQRDRGQATTEYALVLLGAALVGALVVGWATSGGGASAIERLFGAVMDSVIGNL